MSPRRHLDLFMTIMLILICPMLPQVLLALQPGGVLYTDTPVRRLTQPYLLLSIIGLLSLDLLSDIQNLMTRMTQT